MSMAFNHYAKSIISPLLLLSQYHYQNENGTYMIFQPSYVDQDQL
jgi:hypothetical protein